MKKIIVGIIIFLLINAADIGLLDAATKAPTPKAPTPKAPTLREKVKEKLKQLPKRLPGSEGEDPEELEINWLADSLKPAKHIAFESKQVSFIYFYFDENKEGFSANYDMKLQKYSEERFVFAKILVKTNKDKKGKIFITQPDNAAFFTKYELSFSAVAITLDPYGNLLDKLLPPLSPPEIISFLDNADKKFIGIQNDLDSRYEKSEKLLIEIESASPEEKDKKRVKIMPEVIKILQGIIKTPYEGYEVIKKSSAKLDGLNEQGQLEYSDLIKEYVSMPEEDHDPQLIIPELEKMMNIYKGFPVEQEIKDAIKDVKEGKIPEWILKELEQEKRKEKHQDKQKSDKKSTD